jgi:hypothetical protein
MAEGARQPADDLEAEPLPQRDGAHIGGDDEVELHGGIAGGRCVSQRMALATPRPAADAPVMNAALATWLPPPRWFGRM